MRLGERPLWPFLADLSAPADQADQRCRSRPRTTRLRRHEPNEAHRHRGGGARRQRRCLNRWQKEVLMPVDPNAPVRLSAFNWVPPFAQGQVRDLRPRWALEEAGIAYAVRKLDAMAERPADYYEEQPFGQVPSYRDDTVSLFESGAIVLHIGRDCETLLPADPAARARATVWLIAALNSVEPYLMQLATIDGKGLLDRYSNLVAYKARCQARPAFQAALAAQIADFEKREPVPA